MATKPRRLRHELADACALMGFTLVASIVTAVGFSLLAGVR